MKICIDARIYQESGVGRYIRNLVEELQKLDEKNKYFLLLLKKDYDTLLYHNNNFSKVLAGFSWYGVKEQLKLPSLLASLKPDLVHFPHFNVPIFYQGRFVVTIHDLIHQHFAMKRATTLDPLTYKIKSIGYKKVFRNAIKNSVKILVPSNFVKNQLMEEWNMDGEKIIVTPEAVDEKILKISSQKLSTNYIFYVGNAHPHKNVEGLIKAFLKLKENYPDLKLILAGHDHYFWQRIKKEFRDDGIIYKGYVSDGELVALYKNALCFVMPSFEEGFGIPLLEAMACGCPVVSSNAGSLPEVGGDAAIYFNPHDIDDMVEKISKVLNDENLRKDLIIKGEKRFKKFSWERLAKQTLEVYSKCV